MINSGALRRAKRAQRSIMVRKFGHIPIPEILVITCPLTPARSTDRPLRRHTNVNNSINRYGNPNATRGYFGGKSHSHLRLVIIKQRQLKSQSRRKRKAQIVSVSVSSCPQIWNIELDKDRKRESRQQASAAQRDKGQQGSRASDN